VNTPPRRHLHALQGPDDIRRACHPPIVCGIPSIDLLNNLPTAMACDGLLFDVEFLGAWIAPAGAVRFVLRPVDGPPEDAFGFTIDGHTSTDSAELAAALWQDLRQARDLVRHGTTGSGTPDALGIRWLTGPADDLPWTDHLPNATDPVDRPLAARYVDDPPPTPWQGDPLARPTWTGAVNMANLRYGWRGTTWASTQLTWYITTDAAHPHRGYFRHYPSLAYWAASVGTFRTLFHQPPKNWPDDYAEAVRNFLPPGQETPRWGLNLFAGGLWENNYHPDYGGEISFRLTELVDGNPPTFSDAPEFFIRQDGIDWLKQTPDLPPPHIPSSWTNLYKTEIDHRDNWKPQA